MTLLIFYLIVQNTSTAFPVRGYMKKYFIKNRKGQNVSVLLEHVDNQKGLAFVMHGMGGNKVDGGMEAIAGACREMSFTVVRFDTTNTFGESDGAYEYATPTNYFEDLEDVIEASSLEQWYQEPFFLSGHSLGGMCSTLYAQKFPERVAALGLLAPVVSGGYFLKTYEKYAPQELELWRTKNVRVASDGSEHRLLWICMEDYQRYDLLKEISKLSFPVLVVVGEEDKKTPAEYAKVFFDALPGQKELHVMRETPHAKFAAEQLSEIRGVFSQWIDKIRTSL